MHLHGTVQSIAHGITDAGNPTGAGLLSEVNPTFNWVRHAEGSAMLPLLKFYTSRLGEAVAPLEPRIDSEMRHHLGFLDDQLALRDFFVGNDLTGADIQLIYVIQFAERLAGEKAFPHLAALTGA